MLRGDISETVSSILAETSGQAISMFRLVRAHWKCVWCFDFFHQIKKKNFSLRKIHFFFKICLKIAASVNDRFHSKIQLSERS